MSVNEAADATTDPVAAFARFADETEVAVLEEMRESWGVAGSSPVYATTADELRDRLDVDADDLDAHLDRLTPEFLRATDDGYKFSWLGWVVAREFMRDEFVDPMRRSAFQFESRCHVCGATGLEGYYEGQWVWVRCRSCGEEITSIEMPPGTVADRDGQAIAETCSDAQRRRERLLMDGACTECYATTRKAVGGFEWGPSDWERFIYHCEHCERKFLPPVGWHAIDHPAVEEFYAERGVDVHEALYWEIGPLAAKRYTTVTSREPWQFRVEFQWEDDAVTVLLDEDRSVASVER